MNCYKGMGAVGGNFKMAPAFLWEDELLRRRRETSPLISHLNGDRICVHWSRFCSTKPDDAEHDRPTRTAILKKAGVDRSKTFASCTFQYCWNFAPHNHGTHGQKRNQ